MKNKEANKESDLKHGASCSADAGEVKDAMLLNAMEDGNDDYDAVNPNIGRGGQVQGSHNVNVNEQTDLELGALADPGGLDPASDRKFLQEMKDNINKNENKPK